MNIYTDYINQIKTIMADGRYINENRGRGIYGVDKTRLFSLSDFKTKIANNQLLPSMKKFAVELNKQPDFTIALGAHPDFKHLKNTNSFEYHYAVSIFIDIKGSTNLFKKYNNEIVFSITQVIQTAAIHTMLVFDGYVQRLHGDGLFVYFGGKNTPKSVAIEKALQAVSVLNYFVENDLKNLFTEDGIERISTRIGIDFGDDDVLWGKAGIGEISEITTCSLHTSLASKMQSKASSNGVVIGDNVCNEYTKAQEFSTSVAIRTADDNDRYIFRIPEKSFYYKQYDFDWLKFLKIQSFVAIGLGGALTFKDSISRIESPNPLKLHPIAMQSKPYSE